MLEMEPAAGYSAGEADEVQDAGEWQSTDGAGV
jgi:hypothetical protein